MAWVWYGSVNTLFGPAEFDERSPINEIRKFSAVPLEPLEGKPIYRARSSIENFNSLHCPPFLGACVVDAVWKEIIQRFVPAENVQFYPVTLVAKGGESSKFSWVIPFSRVRCIDPQKSDVVMKVEKKDITYVLLCNYYVHHENCLGDVHLARDEQDVTHVVVSDPLRDALAATGETSMFYRPENMPLTGQRRLH